MWRFHKWLWDVSGGRLGQSVGQMDVLELTATGHISGEPRSVLLFYRDSVSGPLVVASNSGHASDPAWAKNLRANPQAKVSKGGIEVDVEAEFLEDPTRQEVLDEFTTVYPDYSAYDEATDRQIPVVLLKEKSGD